MRIERTATPVITFARLTPNPEGAVREIIEDVQREGDRAVLRYTQRFDKAELGPGELQVDPNEAEASLGALEPDVVRGLRTAIANVRAVVRAQLAHAVTVELPEGQRSR